MLSHRFDDALVFAANAHRTQARKASGIPYIAHLMSVSALTIEYGGDEDCAIAALLHDAVEDQGGLDMAQTIRDRFGNHVAQIVLDCSDQHGDTVLDWQDRKDAYVAGINTKSQAALLVTSCDKLHNATSILHDLQLSGLAVFDRFSAKRDGTLWYYRALADAIGRANPGALSTRLERTVTLLEKETADLMVAPSSTG